MANIVNRRAETLKEFCASIGISYDSGYRAAKDGRLFVIRFGTRILVPTTEAERVAREGLHPNKAGSGR